MDFNYQSIHTCNLISYQTQELYMTLIIENIIRNRKSISNYEHSVGILSSHGFHLTKNTH